MNNFFMCQQQDQYNCKEVKKQESDAMQCNCASVDHDLTLIFFFNILDIHFY